MVCLLQWNLCSAQSVTKIIQWHIDNFQISQYKYLSTSVLTPLAVYSAALSILSSWHLWLGLPRLPLRFIPTLSHESALYWTKVRTQNVNLFEITGYLIIIRIIKIEPPTLGSFILHICPSGLIVDPFIPSLWFHFQRSPFSFFFHFLSLIFFLKKTCHRAFVHPLLS